MAHSSVDGIEGFYLGLLHPLTTAPQLLALLAVSLLLAQGGQPASLSGLAAFALAALAGIAMGQAGMAGPEDADAPLLAVALAAAAGAALVPGAPAALGIAAGLLSGLGIGLVSTPDPGLPRATAITLAGCFTGAILALLYGAAAAGWALERYPAQWMKIGQRILAAWVAAIAALLLALAVAGPA